jgi:hypothetical protein
VVFSYDGYVLHSMEATLNGNVKRTIYFFAKVGKKCEKGSPCDFPGSGFVIRKNPKTRMPYLARPKVKK